MERMERMGLFTTILTLFKLLFCGTILVVCQDSSLNAAVERVS